MTKKLFAVALILISLILSACSGLGSDVSVKQPESIASADEVHPSQSPTAAEKSNNVNGMHYVTNLDDFSSRFNYISMDTGGINYIYKANWKTQGKPQLDNNGVEYQLFYYSFDIFTITASVETSSGCIMNVGCGTSMNTFVTAENDVQNSDIILRTCANMAAAVCGFKETSLDLLQDIFYQTTLDGHNSLWYEGNVFTLTTNKKDNTMLFRIFPVSDDLKSEWDITDYDDYRASALDKK